MAKPKIIELNTEAKSDVSLQTIVESALAALGKTPLDLIGVFEARDTMFLRQDKPLPAEGDARLFLLFEDETWARLEIVANNSPALSELVAGPAEGAPIH